MSDTPSATSNESSKNLRGKDLRRNDLRGQDFHGTDLRGANLRDADLEGVDLSQSKGLSSDQLGGTNLLGATLPGHLAGFESVQRIAEQSKTAGALFVLMLTGCIYSWLTVAATTDVGLFTNSVSSKLPVINTDIRIVPFYIVAPLVLFGLYLYYHLYMQRLWEGLAQLPSVFPDGRSLDERVYPWMMNGLVRAHSQRLRTQKRQPRLFRLQQVLALAVAFWTVPLTLVLLWWRFTSRWQWFPHSGDRIGTVIHIFLIVASVGSALGFWWLTTVTLRGEEVPGAQMHPLKSRRTYAIVLGLLLTGIAFGYATPRITKMQISDLRDANLRRADLRGANLTRANLQRADLSASDLRGALLDEADLRLAKLEGANLVKASMDEVKLGGASLREADLQDADLDDAEFDKSTIQQAHNWALATYSPDRLPGLRLRDDHNDRISRNDLSNYPLPEVDLRGADLGGFNLSGANLRGADLRRAVFVHASLDGTLLHGADLRGADLSEAKGLSQAQLNTAITDANTRVSSKLRVRPAADGPPSSARRMPGRARANRRSRR